MDSGQKEVVRDGRTIVGHHQCRVQCSTNRVEQGRDDGLGKSMFRKKLMGTDGELDGFWWFSITTIG